MRRNSFDDFLSGTETSQLNQSSSFENHRDENFAKNSGMENYDEQTALDLRLSELPDMDDFYDESLYDYQEYNVKDRLKQINEEWDSQKLVSPRHRSEPRVNFKERLVDEGYIIGQQSSDPNETQAARTNSHLQDFQQDTVTSTDGKDVYTQLNEKVYNGFDQQTNDEQEAPLYEELKVEKNANDLENFPLPIYENPSHLASSHSSSSSSLRSSILEDQPIKLLRNEEDQKTENNHDVLLESDAIREQQTDLNFPVKESLHNANYDQNKNGAELYFSKDFETEETNNKEKNPDEDEQEHSDEDKNREKELGDENYQDDDNDEEKFLSKIIDNSDKGESQTNQIESFDVDNYESQNDFKSNDEIEGSSQISSPRKMQREKQFPVKTKPINRLLQLQNVSKAQAELLFQSWLRERRDEEAKIQKYSQSDEKIESDHCARKERRKISTRSKKDAETADMAHSKDVQNSLKLNEKKNQRDFNKWMRKKRQQRRLIMLDNELQVKLAQMSIRSSRKSKMLTEALQKADRLRYVFAC